MRINVQALGKYLAQLEKDIDRGMNVMAILQELDANVPLEYGSLRLVIARLIGRQELKLKGEDTPKLDHPPFP